MENLSELVSIEELINKENSRKNIVDELLYEHTFSLISGDSKAGKTTIALQLAYAVSTGACFLGYETNKSGVLYLSVDNRESEFVDRVRKMNFKSNSNLYFEFPEYMKIGYGEYSDIEAPMLIECIEMNTKLIPNLKLVILDVLADFQQVPPNKEYSNLLIKDDIRALIGIAEMFDICIVGITHNKKEKVRNVYNQSCGGMQTVGAINGAYLNIDRIGGSEIAKLLIGGRVRENCIYLKFDRESLKFSKTDMIDENFDFNIAAIRNYIIKKQEFFGSLSELCSTLNLTITSTMLAHLLKRYSDLLLNENIKVEKLPRSSSKRSYHIYFSE